MELTPAAIVDRLPDHHAVPEAPARPARAGKNLSVDGRAASVAAWLDTHRDQLIECWRHNGRARLTMAACAARYRRAVSGWVDSPALREYEKWPLRLSLAVCASCPVGAYNAGITPP